MKHCIIHVEVCYVDCLSVCCAELDITASLIFGLAR